MTPPSLPPELSRPIALTRLTGQDLEIGLRAEPDELVSVARRLLIPEVGSLDARFSLRALPAGIVEADGVLNARVVQRCVVSLEPFEQSIEERFTVRFVPDATEADDLLDPAEIDEIPYGGDRIDLGEAAVEQLALALDPFPRKPGAALPPGIAGETASTDQTARIHPFSSLRARRDAS